MATIRERILELIDKNNLSRKEFSNRVGISQNQMNRYLTKNDPQTPTVNTLTKICDEFNVSMDWICGRNFSENRFKITDDSDVLRAFKEIQEYIGKWEVLKNEENKSWYFKFFDERLTEIINSIVLLNMNDKGGIESALSNDIINTIFKKYIDSLKGIHEAEYKFPTKEFIEEPK